MTRSILITGAGAGIGRATARLFLAEGWEVTLLGRRREALARFVQDQATAVVESGVSRALEPMNAVDRKVVHDTVNEMEGVSTISEGLDPDRRVVIVPDTPAG